MLRTIKSLRNALAPHKITFSICFVGFLVAVAVLSFTSTSGAQAPVPKMTTNPVLRKDSLVRPYVEAPGIITDAEAGRIHAYAYHWYQDFLASKGFNGGMIVAKDGNIVFETYRGTGHIPGTDDIDENTPMQIASTSKTFTAMAILKLWQDGKLNINDPLTKYFPDFNYAGVTIKTLLDHRSGLPNYLYGMADKGWDQSRYVHNKDVLNWWLDHRP